MKRTLFFLLILLTYGQLFGQSLSNKIADAFQLLEDDIHTKHGIVSLTVLNANTGEVIFAKNDHIGLATASTLKTITTITAYEVLGSDFKYTTDLVYTGNIDANGTLQGDIVIKGSGDPSLGSDRFAQSDAKVLLERWVNAIRETGIKKISGGIIADDLLFGGNQAPPGWTWEDMGNYYGAGISSLNWRENTFSISLSPGARVGEPVRLVGTEPDVSYLRFINEVKTGRKGSGDGVYAYSAPYSSIIALRGTYGIDLNKKIFLSSPDGAYAAALALQTALGKQQVDVGKPATTAYLMEQSGHRLASLSTSIDRYESPPLSKICHWFNRVSINVYGEALLKAIALHKNVDLFTDEITKWEKHYWAEKLHIDTGSLKIEDGSGLSPENRVTTMAMATILAYAKSQAWFGEFYENLPTYNNMKMKSGTIGGVLGYAGYQMASNGTPLVFSLLVNNYTGPTYAMRRKMFSLLNALK